jgi:hypothetical protein
VVSVTSPDFTVDPAFDGNGHTSLLAAGNTLAVGQTGTILVVVEAHSGGKIGPYSNTSTASGVSPAGAPVTDVSQAGTDPDPDHDGNPGNNSDPTVFALTPVQIPALNGLGLAALGALLGALALWRLRRERQGRGWRMV